MNLNIKNNWKYIGNDKWDWEVFIDDKGSGELTEVESVEYILHPTFPNPVINVTDPEEGFRLKLKGWGTFDIKAFIYKKNGEKEKLIHHIELKYEPKTGTSEL